MNDKMIIEVFDAKDNIELIRNIIDFDEESGALLRDSVIEWLTEYNSKYNGIATINNNKNNEGIELEFPNVEIQVLFKLTWG